MANPKFNVDEVVYLTESAKVGSIESYKVSGVRQDPSGAWLYRISIPRRPPNSNMTYGDRNALRRDLDFELSEDELTTFCNAVEIALVAAENNANRIRRLKDTYCADETESTGGTDG